MSRKKIDVRPAAALVAFAVVVVTGGVFYAQSGTSTDASLVLSRPDLAISTQQAQAPQEAPDLGATPTPSADATPDSDTSEAAEPVLKAAQTSATKKPEPKKKPEPAKPEKNAAAGPGSTDAVVARSAANDRIKFGEKYSGIATFYGATGAGNCSYEPTGDLMVAAMNEQDYQGSQACGSFVDVTGPKGNTVRVKIVDRCPECAPGHIDLSAEAFAELAEPVQGRIDISWKLVSPSVSGPVKYVYKDGSSQWWCSIQVRNHRNPIRSVELKGKNGWVALPREMHNYFTSANGEGCGGQVRITDVQGNRLTDSGIQVNPNQEQAGAQQLPAA
ncbi:hypothetical protein LWF15_31320 [Kineosporia rhizophila]|uniref:expansin EXLX1 family cellulose-binding protein n=1 Tax=Kineosporia rhizophila TaxID=84633 RepID=UPI001E449B2D|nr:hypothetical protein [Kineosporia rhizophila]